MSYYRIVASTVPASRSAFDADVTAYVVDRLPDGPLAAYCKAETELAARYCCGAGGRHALMPGAGTTTRFAIELPASVRALYSGNYETGYLNEYSLAGMLSWLELNNYTLVDLRDGFWVQYSGASGAAEVPLASTSANQYFQLRYRSTREASETVTTLVVDRYPVGPLRSYAQPYTPPASCCSVPGSGDGYAVRLPATVASKYRFREASAFCNENTYPAMLTWLQDNGYEWVDLYHAFGSTDAGGLWFQYTGTDYAGAGETTRARRELQASSRATRPRVAAAPPRAAAPPSSAATPPSSAATPSRAPAPPRRRVVAARRRR